MYRLWSTSIRRILESFFKSSVEPYLTWKLTKSDKCNTREECLWSLWVLVIAWRDACFRWYVTSKSVNDLHEYTFHFFCYVYLNLSTQKDINFLPGNLNKSSWSSGMEERQLRQRYREALVQITATTEKKREKGNRGALERVVGEWEGKKEEERDGKR